MLTSPAGVGTTNDCAGEDQQQFTRQTGQPTLFPALLRSVPISDASPVDGHAPKQSLRDQPTFDTLFLMNIIPF
jgi:hypothetical protein